MTSGDPILPVAAYGLLLAVLVYIGSRVQLARLLRFVRRTPGSLLRYDRAGVNGRVLLARDRDGVTTVCYGVRPVGGQGERR